MPGPTGDDVSAELPKVVLFGPHADAVAHRRSAEHGNAAAGEVDG